MVKIIIKLSGNLAELLPTSKSIPCTRRLSESTSVKDAVEALGIPHCEIDMIEMENQPVSFNYLVQNGDQILVHPAQPRPLTGTGFICDQHLGKLARMLRTLGFDTSYNTDWLEPELARRSTAQNRTILTGNRALLKRRTITCGQLIRCQSIDQQVVEVLTRFELLNQVKLFGRCSLCNGLVKKVAKQEIATRIPPRTALWLNTYYICNDCSQLYWEGTHVLALRRRIAAILKKVPQ